MKIALLGDSIFDNALYVGDSESVSDLLLSLKPDLELELLAVDGDVTTDVFKQLSKLPASADYVFVSCGGNDALRAPHRKLALIRRNLCKLASTKPKYVGLT